MSITSLEKAILREARVATGNPKLKMEDILEWSTGKVEVKKNEKLYTLPIGVDIVVGV